MPISYTCTELTEGFVSINAECTCEEECGGTCETSCLYCMINDGCDSCEGSCETTCENSCQCSVEGCETCQTTCQNNCQSTCELQCEGTQCGWCEVYCQSDCQLFCMNCESTCQECENVCQMLCEDMCQDSCEKDCQSCQINCQDICQTGCQTCQLAQSSPPEPITNLRTVGEIEPTAFQIAFDGSENADSYEIYVDGILEATTSSTTGIYIMNRMMGTTYNVCVKACNAYGCSISVCINVTTAMLRPDNWEWSYNIASGMEVLLSKNGTDGKTYAYILTAIEWNQFTFRINEFRAYKQISRFIFNDVNSEDDFTLEIINDAIRSINGLGFSIPLLTETPVYASTFIIMRDRLNSVQ